MAFNDELAKSNFQGNIVLQIDGTYYASYLPDSGLAVDADKIGILDNVNTGGTTVQVKTAKTTISSFSFDLVDDGAVSLTIGTSQTSLLGKTVNFYFGFITGSFDWSEYKLISTLVIKEVSKKPGRYLFKCKENTDLLQRSIYSERSQLNGAILAATTVINLLDVSNLPTSGMGKIEDEFISWGGTSGNSLTGVNRGLLGSTAVGHDDQVEFLEVTKLEGNPIQLIRDVMENEIGIATSKIDTTAFNNLRDNDFSLSGDWVLYAYDIENGLDFIEREILLPTNTRLFLKDGLISIALLDQVDYDNIAAVFDEDAIIGVPEYDLSANSIVNKIIIKWDYSEGLQRYGKIKSYSDATSIANYGESRELTLEFKGITSTNTPESFLDTRAKSFFSRLATPETRIKTKTFFNKLNTNISEDVRLIHSQLPEPGSGAGFDSILEVISKSIKGWAEKSVIEWKLSFASFSNIRVGLISPSPVPSNIINQKTFDVPDGTKYEVGYKLVLWDNVNDTYFSDPVNTVSSINGNTITMENNFTTTLAANTSLFFANYSDCSQAQKNRYAFISPNSNVFSDGANSYGIIL